LFFSSQLRVFACKKYILNILALKEYQLARTVKPLKIGLFALVGLALTVGAVIWLGAAYMFEYTETYATYFNVSIKGLRKDAVVNYKGVPVGRVSDIRIAPDGRLVEVLMKLRPDFKVDNTICAELHEQGFTGLRYLEIGTAPEDVKHFTPKITFRTKYPYIQSYPSEFELLTSGLHNIYEKIISVDLEGLADNWKTTSGLFNNLLVQLGGQSETGGDLKDTISALKNASKDSEVLLARLSKAVSQDRVDKGMKDLSTTLASTREATEKLRKQFDSLPPGTLKRLTDQFGETIQSGGSAVSDLGKSLNASAGLLEQNLQQLGSLIAQLNGLVQNVRQQPNRLIFQNKQTEEPFKSKSGGTR
jgi:ABC-type transporter Mla subunit MlaD